MIEGGTLISLSDCRRKRAAAKSRGLRGNTRSAAGRTVGHPWASVLAVCGLLAIGAVGLAAARAPTPRVSQLPLDLQAALFNQTLDQVGSICHHAAAAIGELREHCENEARFLLKFPLCDSGCRARVYALLPHGRHR